jgi:hypothetical protein
MPKKAIKVSRSVRLRAYPVIENAVESGVRYGWNRVWKHVDKPKKMPEDENVVAEITSAVMNELCELLDFGDGEET